MNWINTSILSAAVFGIVNILDSHFLSKRLPNLQSFFLPLSIIYLIYCSVFLSIFPIPPDTSIGIILLGIASGMFRTSGAVIMLSSLTRDEVSRVVPISLSYPIFVAILAVPLLGEHLHYTEWLSTIIVVAGAIMISTNRRPSGTSINWKQLSLLCASSLLFALSDLSSKYVLHYMSSWELFGLVAFSMFAIMLAISFRTNTIRQLANLKKKKVTYALLVFNEILTMAAIFLVLWAIEKGPVSLVSTISSTRPMFVLIFAFLLSRIAPSFLSWQPGRGLLSLRIIAVAMIVGGITIIHLA